MDKEIRYRYTTSEQERTERVEEVEAEIEAREKSEIIAEATLKDQSKEHIWPFIM